MFQLKGNCQTKILQKQLYSAYNIFTYKEREG